jgi:hypothetical protein
MKSWSSRSQVFKQLLRNYELEKQLAFENAAIANKDGIARLFVADHQDETADLTVFASLKKDALIRGLDYPKAVGVQAQVREVEVPTLSVQTLLAKHRITKIDLLLTRRARVRRRGGRTSSCWRGQADDYPL